MKRKKSKKCIVLQVSCFTLIRYTSWNRNGNIYNIIHLINKGTDNLDGILKVRMEQWDKENNKKNNKEIVDPVPTRFTLVLRRRRKSSKRDGAITNNPWTTRSKKIAFRYLLTRGTWRRRMQPRRWNGRLYVMQKATPQTQQKLLALLA